MEASDSFVAVYWGGSELAPKALDNLRTIHRLLYPSTTISFETFLQEATDRWTTVLQNSNKATDKKSHTELVVMVYLGFDSCCVCHVEIYKGWSESGMVKMLCSYVS